MNRKTNGAVAATAIILSACTTNQQTDTPDQTSGAPAQQTGTATQPSASASAMTFFVTSRGSGKGADLGGLSGADRICQDLAAAAGAGSMTWHAYLSAKIGRASCRERGL